MAPNLIPESHWEDVRQRARLAHFAPALERLRGEVAAFLAQPVSVPAKPGGYYHDFFCPDHGVELLFDPTSPHVHRCGVDGAIHRGEHFDAAWRWFVNDRLAQAAIRLAVMWQLEGNAEHLASVVQILGTYADHYPAYQDLPRATPNPGVATYTTLDESVWILPLAWAFDSVRSTLSPEEANHITNQLFVPAAEHLVRHHFRDIHNFACWHNAAIGTIGLLANRADLVDFAIDGPFGFHVQVREGVLADGLWFEGSFSYHFYTLAALLALAKASAQDPKLDLRQHPALRQMLVAPIYCAYPDGTLPATNDCWYFTGLIDACCHGVPPAPAFYEVGYAWYGEPLFCQVLDRAYRHSSRDSLDALLYGREPIPSGPIAPLPSTHLPASGYAILRSPSTSSLEDRSVCLDDQAKQRYLLLKYGPHGGGHGHPDKLALTLYAEGMRFSPDLGTPGYGVDLFESWYRQTLSHNTVIIDGRSQPPATGHLHFFQGEGQFQVADAAVHWDGAGVELATAYAGISMRRVILPRPDYFLDLFLVHSTQSRRIEWIYRNSGRQVLSVDLHPYQSMENAGDGYSHLSGVRGTKTAQDLEVHWQLAGAGLQLFMAGRTETELISGSVPGNPPAESYAAIILRRYAQGTSFLSLFHPYRATSQIRSVTWSDGDLASQGWVGCLVELTDHSEEWVIQGSPNIAVTPPAAHQRFVYCLESSGESL
jgi:hypothetical protein